MEIYQRFAVYDCDTEEDIEEMSCVVAELTMSEHSHEHHYGFEVEVHSNSEFEGLESVVTFRTSGKYSSDGIIEIYEEALANLPR